MFIIKTKYGSYVEKHSDGKQLNYCFTDVERAMKYTPKDLCEIFDKFSDSWDEYGFEVYKVEISIKRDRNWHRYGID
jgi:hypothetical protein